MSLIMPDEPTGGEPAIDLIADRRQAAELALLKHLALEGELSLRRDQLAAEHQAVTQRLVEARGRREALVAAVKEAGGELPRWEV